MSERFEAPEPTGPEPPTPGRRKKTLGITNGEIWQFIQDHKNDKLEFFGGWLIGQSAKPTDKIIKAICAWNERHKK